MQDRMPSYPADALPGAIPVFPLAGVLLLPRGHLPLNIFEPRYRAMVDDALRSDRLIGMIQPMKAAAQNGADLFSIGCAGRITSFTETEDDRYLITLTGLSRFKMTMELPPQQGYRRAAVDWSAFAEDLKPMNCLDLDRAKLQPLLSSYFSLHGLSCDWDMIDGATDERLITCLSMICPFDPCEKQALLEAPCCRSRAGMFLAMLELAVHGGDQPESHPVRH